MKLHLKPLVVSLSLLLLMSGNSWAQANSDSPAGWAAYGDVASTGDTITLTTAYLGPDGNESPNVSGHSALDVLRDDLGGKAGVDITAFDLGDDYAVEGSLITKSFNALAGQTLSFDWSFSSFEDMFLDNAFVIVNGSLVSLATAAQPGAASQTYRYTFAQSGNVSLALGVVDTTSTAGVSIFSFGNLQLSQVTAVPEPTTYALLLGGLGLIGVAARRRQGVKLVD